jgi:alpha-tubulin suppressor-like RCC1 family protein
MSLATGTCPLRFSVVVMTLGLATAGCSRDLVLERGSGDGEADGDRDEDDGNVDALPGAAAASGASQASSSSSSSAAGGSCEEAGAPCDDGDACTDGDACDAGACVGRAIQCEEPPAASCIDASTRRTSGTGSCNEGTCVYVESTEPCPHGCVDGACNLVTPAIVAGDFHTCALSGEGRVRCWGLNDYGQLGYGHTETIGDDETPATAGDVDVGGVVTQISLGLHHTCALLETGAVRCWGSGHFGLGYGGFEAIGDDEVPADVGDIDLGEPVVEVATGGQYICARTAAGNVRCWGNPSMGIYGNGTIDPIYTLPAKGPVVELGGAAEALSGGSFGVCALVAGAVRCWGANFEGQLGYASTELAVGDDETVASMGEADLGVVATQVANGRDHACAIGADATLRCWGMGFWGALGYGNTERVGDDETPGFAGAVDVGGLVTQVSLGWSHTCALLADGAVRCWGNSAEGQLGTLSGLIGDDEVPASVDAVPLGDAPRVVAISSGAAYACVRLVTGGMRCWGRNVEGQLGYGDTVNHLANEIGDIEVW